MLHIFYAAPLIFGGLLSRLGAVTFESVVILRHPGPPGWRYGYFGPCVALNTFRRAGYRHLLANMSISIMYSTKILHGRLLEAPTEYFPLAAAVGGLLLSCRRAWDLRVLSYKYIYYYRAGY